MGFWEHGRPPTGAFDPVHMQTFGELMRTAVKDRGIGDVNSDAKGSGARYNTGKAKLHMIPLCTLEGEARVWEYGAKKYAIGNWMKGAPWSVPFDSLMRHMALLQAGELYDVESGQLHTSHILCNARMLEFYILNYPEGNDLDFIKDALKILGEK